MFYWLAKFIFIGPFLRLLWRPWAEGTEHVPATGGAILASNHLSFCDSFFMPLMLHRRVTFLAKAEYFTTPGIKGLLSRLFFAAIGQVPIDRSGADAANGALNTGVRVLGQGQLLGIYPEGTRSPDGRLFRGKTGVARLVLASGATVVPCVMVNTDVIQPAGRLVPRLRPRPGVRFGAPLDFSRYMDAPDQRAAERAITDRIMTALMVLSRQEYADMYAADFKKNHGSARAFGARVHELRGRRRHHDSRSRAS